MATFRWLIAAVRQYQHSNVNDAIRENLFRKAAIESLKYAAPGRPIGLAPRPWFWLGCLVFVILGVAAAFLISTDYARGASARGWLVSEQGVTRVTATSNAIATSISIREGDSVEKGDTLMVLEFLHRLPGGDEKVALNLAGLRDELAEIDSQIELATEGIENERADVSQQLHELQSEWLAIEAAINAQESRLSAAETHLNRLEPAQRNGTISERDLMRERDSVEAVRQQLFDLQRSRSRLQRERAALTGRYKVLPGTAALQRSSLQERRFRIQRQVAEQQSRRSSVVVAPVSGVIASINVHPGDAVTSGRLLAVVLPQSLNLEAELFLPSSAVGFVQIGQEVKLAYDAYPRQKFGLSTGRVSGVSNFVFLPDEIPQAVAVSGASYRLRVDIDNASLLYDGAQLQLRPGMSLSAELVLESRSLLEWLLEPFALRHKRLG